MADHYANRIDALHWFEAARVSIVRSIAARVDNEGLADVTIDGEVTLLVSLHAIVHAAVMIGHFTKADVGLQDGRAVVPYDLAANHGRCPAGRELEITIRQILAGS